MKHGAKSPIRCAGLRHGAQLALLCAVMIAAGSALAESGAPEKLEIAGQEVAAWIPRKSTPGPWPVVIFSHGFHGCNTQSTFLTKALAAAGYAVFAPNHRDAACRDLRAWLSRPEMGFGDPKDWSEATYSDRVQDIEKLLDALHGDPRFSGPPFDWNHVALVGHSLGGYTALDAAGAWGKGGDARVKAVLALSPYASPFIKHETLHALGAPVMYQGGTRDVGITPFLIRSGGAYDQTPAPKYFVEFDGAGHFAWTDLRTTYQQEIEDYSRAFLDRYLKGTPFPANLEQPHPGVTVVKIDAR